MTAITGKKARLLDLVTGVLEMTRDGSRDIDGVSDILQFVKDNPEFASLVGSSRRTMENVFSLTVDYSVRPTLLDLEVVEHPSRTDTAVIDLGQVERVLVPKDGESYVEGEENLKRLKLRYGEANLLDVRVLEELLKHPYLIPEEWKSGVTYFWGTIFRGAGRRRGVAYLGWDGRRWRWDCRWLEDSWNSYEPAAVLRK